MHTNACIYALCMPGGSRFFIGNFSIIFTVILSHVWRQSVHGVQNYGQYQFPLVVVLSHLMDLCYIVLSEWMTMWVLVVTALPCFGEFFNSLFFKLISRWGFRNTIGLVKFLVDSDQPFKGNQKIHFPTNFQFYLSDKNSLIKVKVHIFVEIIGMKSL